MSAPVYGRAELFVRAEGHGRTIVPIAIPATIWNQSGHTAAIGKFDGAQGHDLERPLFQTAACLPDMRSLRRLRGRRDGGNGLGVARRRGLGRLLFFLMAGRLMAGCGRIVLPGFGPRYFVLLGFLVGNGVRHLDLGRAILVISRRT